MNEHDILIEWLEIAYIEIDEETARRNLKQALKIYNFVTSIVKSVNFSYKHTKIGTVSETGVYRNYREGYTYGDFK